MKRRAWKTRIEKACIDAGTYKPYFKYIFSTLAEILEKRDQVWDELDNNEMIIEMTNKSGFTNVVKNPLLTLWNDLNKSALSYWRDLGLTPAGLKKLNDESFAKKEQTAGNSLLGLLEKRRGQNDE